MRFEVLGGVRAVEDGRDVALGNKTRVVLAALLARPNRSVSVDALMDCLWGDEVPASGANTLQWHVHQLRKRLGDPGRVSYDAASYTVRIGRGELDSLEFEDALGRSYADARAEFEALERALGLWRGDAFGNCADHRGVRDEARRLDQLRVAASERRVEVGLGLGEHEALVPELAQLVRRHPGRERFRAQSMLALHRCGRRAEALRVYREARDYLVDELGLEPGTELRELERRILNDDPHLRADPGPSDARPRPRPAELPANVPAFTGRATELSRIDGWLEPGPTGPRAVAVDGVGGMGKSSLAVRAAHLAKGHYPDGQLYVNLHGATPDAKPLAPMDVLARFLRSLGDTEAARLTNADEMASRYRTLTAGLRLLVVLDDARDVAQVRPLLPAGADGAVLVTSRRRLGTLSGARHLSLDRLSPNDSRLLLDRLAGEALEGAAPSVVDQLVEWCDGMPLALHVCAARLLEDGGGSAAALVERLSDEHQRLSALAVDDLAVRATFQVSYDELEPAAARVFRLLGLHDGPDVALAVVAVLADTDEDTASDLLRPLLRARLIAEHHPGRYRSHDLIRLYARELAVADESADERNSASRRMLVGYCAGARAALGILNPAMTIPFAVGPAVDTTLVDISTPEDARAWITTETANAIAACHGCPDIGDLPAIAVSTSLAFGSVVHDIGSQLDLLALRRAAVAAADRSADPALRARAHSHLGVTLLGLGHATEAKGHLLTALSAWSDSGRWELGGGVLSRLAAAARQLGDLDEADRYADQSLDACRRSGDALNETVAWMQKSFVLRRLGRSGDAIRAQQRAADIAQRIGENYNYVCAIGNIADIHLSEGRADLATDTYTAALEADERLDLTGTLIHAEHLWGLARALHDTDHAERARALWTRSADILRNREAITPAEHAAILAKTPPEQPAILDFLR